MKQLITGIDPGITTAFCCLDLNGRLIKAFSSKKLGLEKLIAELRSVGTPVIIACDVRIPPAIVTKLSAIFNAKLVYPQEDLKIGEKKTLCSDFKLKNIHQKDACAAAVFAFNRHKLLFKKVDDVLKEAGKIERRDEIKAKLILGKAKSIKDALIEKPLPIMLQTKKRNKEYKEPLGITIIENELRTAREKITELEKENKRLKDKIEWKELVSDPNQAKSKISELRKITIENLESKCKKLEERTEQIKKQLNIEKQKFRLYKETEIKFVTKLADLSSKEIEKLDDADFENCLFVENITLPGKETISKLKELGILEIFYGRLAVNVSEIKKMGFFVAESSEVKLENSGNLVFISRDSLEQLKKSKSLELDKIIEEHRKRLV